MDYLTVPAISSGSQLDKEVFDQTSTLSPAPAAVQASSKLLGPSQDTVISATTVLIPKKGRSENSQRKFRKIRSKAGHSSQGLKRKTSEQQRRRRRRRRQMSMREMISRNWNFIYPYLQLLWKTIYELTQSLFFDIFICTVVAMNTILLVVQTFAIVEIRGEWFFSAMDAMFLCIYITEAFLKLIALNLDYFRDPWNDIDFFIMFMAILEFTLPLFISANKANLGNAVTLFRVLKIFKGIRAIRAIRFLLTLRVTENLREITSTFMLSFQSIGAIIILMFSFLFMSSVVLRDMFHEADEKHFGDLFKTIFTLFQLFTLDDWTLIYLTCLDAGAWYIIIFLIIYILVEYFLLLNLVIAVLVDNFQMSLLKRQEMKRLKQKMIQLKDSSTEENAAGWSADAEKRKTKEEQEEVMFRRMVMEHYSSLELSEREWQILYSYFQLMTAIETNHQQFQSQASTTDKILNTFFESSEEELLSK